MPSSLVECIQQQFNSHSNATSSSSLPNARLHVQLHVVTSEPGPTSPVVAEYKTTQRDRLVFLSICDVCEDTQGNLESKNGKNNDIKCTIAYGMAVSEFTYTIQDKKHTLVYIEKIDSTGYPNLPRLRASLPKILIDGYLHYLKQTMDHQVTIHVFGVAKPQYLFPNSEFSKQKHVMSDQELLKWWKKTLSGLTVNALQDLNDVKDAWWYIPSTDKHTAEQTYTTPSTANSLKWIWGLPYSPNALAHNVIPKFPDDAKSRLLSSRMVDKNTKVEEFVEYLGNVGEFLGKRAGIFVVPLHCDRCDDGSKVNEDAVHETEISYHQLTAFSKELMSTTWKSLDDAQTSTKKVIDAMKKMGIHGVAFDVTLEVRPTTLPATTTTNTNTTTTSAVNNLQSMIKKRSNATNTTNPTQTTQVNNLQSLIRKKEPVAASTNSTNSTNNVQSLVRKKESTTSSTSGNTNNTQDLNNIQNLVKRKQPNVENGEGDVKKPKTSDE